MGNGTRLCVLCATRKQTDFSLAERMNLECDALFANQASCFAEQRAGHEGKRLRMLTTETRGIGVNRNVALMAADSELLLFSDDDVQYYKGYAEAVCKAFDEQPKADVIVFGLDITNHGAVSKQRREKKRRLHRYNGLGAGACRIAVRASSIAKKRIAFSPLFGGSATYSHGEDSLFLLDCYRSGLRVYGNPFVLGQCAQDVSSWFRGHHEKYFYDKGALIAAGFPRTKSLMKWVFLYKFRKTSQLPKRVILRRMKEGMRGYRQAAPLYETPKMRVLPR